MTSFANGYAARKIGGSQTYLHRVRAEQALGKALPSNAIVHHADGSKQLEATLVICQDQAYHMLLHARMRIVQAGGNPNTDAMCYGCRQAKVRSEFRPDPVGVFGVDTRCRTCIRAYEQRRCRRRPRYTLRTETGS